MSSLPPINQNFFPISHDLRGKDTVQDFRYLRTSITKGEERETVLLKRFSALLDTRSPSLPCLESTKLTELPWSNIHTRVCTGHSHRDTQQKSSCSQGHWVAVPSLTALHSPSPLGSSIKSPCFKEALPPSPQLKSLAIPLSCTKSSQHLATPAKGFGHALSYPSNDDACLSSWAKLRSSAPAEQGSWAGARSFSLQQFTPEQMALLACLSHPTKNGHSVHKLGLGAK